MGYQERDYYRDESASDPLGLSNLSMTTKIIIVTVLAYLIDIFFGGPAHQVVQFLKLDADWWVKPWQGYALLTYALAHDPNDPKHILFTMMSLFFLGRMLEERWGGKALLRYYLTAVVFCGLVWSVRHFFLMGVPRMELIGASGGVTAVVILFCLQNPKATIGLMFIPVPAWVAGVILVTMDLLGVDFTPDPNKPQTAYDVHLAGAAFAVAVWSLKLNFGRIPWLDSPGSWFKKLSSFFKSRPNLRVHTDSANYTNLDEDEELELEGDRILAKISTHGDASLTAKERRTLEKYSRLMRDRRK